MNFCQIEFRGEKVCKWTNMWVLLPQEHRDRPLPVLYLLHGMSDDHSTWLRRTGLERFLDGLPLIVVMPDGGLNWYVNDSRRFGLNYEDHIIHDVVGFVDRTFRTVPSAKGRAISGNSMGGFGAMMLALRHPDVFDAVSAHSGAMAFAHRSGKKGGDVQAFAATLPRGKYDCFALANRLRRRRRKPAIRFDCGTDDFLIQDNRDFHAHLNRIGLSHVYEEFPGKHGWDYWDTHIRDTLAFVMARFTTNRVVPK